MCGSICINYFGRSDSDLLFSVMPVLPISRGIAYVVLGILIVS